MPHPTLTLSAHSDIGLDLVAVQYLVGRGYVVEEPGTWETRAEFCRRVGISVSRFKRRMRRRKFAPDVQLDRGAKGRLLRIKSNPGFDRWMKGPT